MTVYGLRLPSHGSCLVYQYFVLSELRKNKEPGMRDRLEGKDHDDFIKQMVAGTPRAARARRFANEVLHLMGDYLPRDRDAMRLMDQYLIETGFQMNLQIIDVPPEWDHLNKLEIEKAMLDAKMKPLTVPAPPGF